jgi:uncharacterized membrane protein
MTHHHRAKQMKINHAAAQNKWLEKISTGISLLVMALGFVIVGLVSFTTEHQGDVINRLPFANALFMIDGTGTILIGATFLVAAYIYWRRYF